jgi:hypothetical protein
MGIPGRNRIVAFACVVCSVGRDAAELLVWWDCRRQKTLSVAIPYKGSTGPLHLLVADLTGNGVQDARDVLASAPAFNQVEQCTIAAFVRFNFSEESARCLRR